MASNLELEYEYKTFINDKLMEYFPADRVIRGSDVNFRCPFCGDSKKSAIKKRGHYSLTKCVYHCFNCDVSVGGLKLLQLFSGESFEDIKTQYVRLRLKEKGITPNYKNFKLEAATSLSSIQDVKPIVRKSWKNPLTEDAKKYLADRKVLEAPFFKDEFYSYTCKSGVEYILIPWKVNYVPCYYQLNDFKKMDKFGRKYIFPRNTEKPVFGLDNIDLGWNKILIFEGIYDSLFVKNGICVGGKNLTDYQLKLITERYPKHELVLAFDNDQSGLKAMGKMIKRFPERFKYFKWFDANTKEKDINDYVLSKNDATVFSDQKKLDKLIVSPIAMKMHLLERRCWEG